LIEGGSLEARRWSWKEGSRGNGTFSSSFHKGEKLDIISPQYRFERKTGREERSLSAEKEGKRKKGCIFTLSLLLFLRRKKRRIFCKKEERSSFTSGEAPLEDYSTGAMIEKGGGKYCHFFKGRRKIARHLNSERKRKGGGVLSPSGEGGGRCCDFSEGGKKKEKMNSSRRGTHFRIKDRVQFQKYSHPEKKRLPWASS